MGMLTWRYIFVIDRVVVGEENGLSQPEGAVAFKKLVQSIDLRRR